MKKSYTKKDKALQYSKCYRNKEFSLEIIFSITIDYVFLYFQVFFFLQKKNTIHRQKSMKRGKKLLDSNLSHRSKEEIQKKALYIELSAKVLQELAATQKLLEKVQPNKIKKMVRDIRNNNTSFHEYMNQARLHTLKSEDILLFEEKYQRYQVLDSADKKSKKRSLERVKIGFQEFRKKLQEYEFADFANEINYSTTTFEREAKKLEKIGEVYEGIGLVRVPFSIIKDLQGNEFQNGLYSKIDRNLIKKTALIEIAEQKFKRAVQEE